MNKLRILIVDDEPVVLKLMQSMLTDFGTCRVAENISQALTQVKASINTGEYFDLITIDIGLPDGSGLSLLEEITDIEKMNSVKAIKFVVSATGTAENVVRAMTRRSNDFLVKPVDRKLMLQKLIKHGLVKENL